MQTGDTLDISREGRHAAPLNCVLLSELADYPELPEQLSLARYRANSRLIRCGQELAMRAGSLALTVACVGCASIYSIESTSNTPLQPSMEHKVVDGSMEFSVATQVSGQTVAITIEQQEKCATLTTPRSHRRRYVDRRVDPTMSRTTWAVASLSLGAGAYGALNAEQLAARSTEPDSPTAAQYRQYSTGLLAIGVVAAAIGIIDGVRANNSEYDDGVIASATTREETVCRRHATSDRAVELQLHNGQRLAARSDSTGNVAFDFSDVPDAGLPGDSTSEYLAIGSAKVEVKLSQNQRAEIRSSLLADPKSRLAIDLLQKRRDACASAVANARGALGSATDVSREVLGSWQSAKSDCGDVWTPSYETELVNVATRVVETECRSGIRAVDQALVDDIDVSMVSSAIATLRELCKTPEHVARIGQLDARLATTVKRLEREAAAEARRIAREEAIQQAVERARSQRSVPAPTWPSSERRSCCKICSKGQACGNTCISRSKTCHVGVGCACDG